MLELVQTGKSWWIIVSISGYSSLLVLLLISLYLFAIFRGVTGGENWIIIDPAAGLVETLLPTSRQHRRKRLMQTKILKEKERLIREQLLAEIRQNEKQQKIRWNEKLVPSADELAVLLCDTEGANENSETKAVEIGVKAWQIGGIKCMKQLHSMVLDICKQKPNSSTIGDYLAGWWDGIGSWQNQFLEETIRKPV